MPILTAADGGAAIHALAPEQARAMSMRLGRILADALRRGRNPRIEHAVQELDHPGVVDDFLRASCRG